MKKRKKNKNPKVKKVEVAATAKTTKYFGKVSLNQWGEFDGKLNGQNVRISMAGFNDDFEDKLPFFWQVVDKYMEIYEKTKNALVEYYDEEDDDKRCWSIRYFFNELFGYKPKRELREVFGVTNFEDFDITSFVEKMKYPYLTIHYGCGLEIYVGYTPSDLENWYDKRLLVVLDKNLKVKNFCAILD